MDAKTLFTEKLPTALKDSPEKAREIDAIYLFNVSGGKGGTWSVDCKSDPPAVNEGAVGAADCTIDVADTDLETLLDNPQLAIQLFFQGKIKVSGDPVLATKLGTLFGIGG